MPQPRFQHALNGKRRALTALAACARSCAPSIASGDVILVPPAAPGSLGDQAMMEGLLNALTHVPPSRCRIGVRSPGEDWRLPGNKLGCIDLGSILRPAASGWDFARLAVETLSCRHAYVLGADVLDGNYGESSSISTIGLGHFWASIGVPVTICGFSFNESPSPECAAALAALPRSVVLCARDPLSHQRLLHRLGRDVRLTADLAFLVEPRTESEATQALERWIRYHRSAGSLCLGVNLNCLFARRLGFDQDCLIRSYLAAFRRLASCCGSLCILGIPHDSRGAGGDWKLLDLFARRVHEERLADIRVLHQDVAPAEVKHLCTFLDMVLTGRMHVAIASLGSGTPVGCITYQGKFEGLMQHFGLSECTLPPADAFRRQRLPEFLFSLVNRRRTLHARVASGLPHVLQLARANVATSARDTLHRSQARATACQQEDAAKQIRPFA